MSFLRTTITALTIFGFTLVGTANAKSGDWKTFDINNDMKMSPLEFGTYRVDWFFSLDKNDDGNLNVDEFAVAGGHKSEPEMQRRRKRFVRVDKDKDGFWKSDELEVVILNEFINFDVNKDGVLTPDEIPNHL